MKAITQHIARRVAPSGTWTEAPLDSVTLDYDARYRRRLVLTCDGETQVLLDLPEARVLNDGDALVTESGRHILVRAAPERLLEVRCRDRRHLARVAWHLGNRHLATEILDERLRIRADHVIANMLRELGAEVVEVEAPFNPEGGAYGGDHRHGPHGHGHEH